MVSSITFLNLARNQIEIIKENTFSQFTSLISIRLDYNQINRLEKSWSNGLEKLEGLNLDFNQFNNLETASFSNESFADFMIGQKCLLFQRFR
jgi:Leucine-rich repeat (LRR) protein